MTTAPSICERMRSGFTCGPQSTAMSMACTFTWPFSSTSTSAATAV